MARFYDVRLVDTGCFECTYPFKSGSRVNTLSARFRHYNIKLLLFSTQVFRYVSNVVRQNTTNLIVGSPFPNRKELLKIAEEFGDVFEGTSLSYHYYTLMLL